MTKKKQILQVTLQTILTTGIRSLKRFFRISSIVGAYERVKEIVLFLPVLWRIRTWNYIGLLELMHHWLGRMRVAHENDTWHEYSQVRVEQIRLCQNLVMRMYNNEYTENFWNDHNKRWGNLEYKFLPTNNPEYSTLRSWRNKANSVEDQMQEHRESVWIMNHEHHLFKQDLEYLFIMFKKHIKGWWT